MWAEARRNQLLLLVRFKSQSRPAVGGTWAAKGAGLLVLPASNPPAKRLRDAGLGRVGPVCSLPDSGGMVIALSLEGFCGPLCMQTSDLTPSNLITSWRSAQRRARLSLGEGLRQAIGVQIHAREPWSASWISVGC
jgi:hypothetical protein